MKIKRFEKRLTEEDIIDVTLYFDKSTIVRFALNYRAVIHGRWAVVYRVDNFHGFLHEQRFWRISEPIVLPHKQHIPMNILVDEYIDELMANYLKYRSYLKAAR